MRKIFKVILIAIVLAVLLIRIPPIVNRLNQGLPLSPTRLINISGTGSMYPTFPKGVGSDPQSLHNQTVTSVPMYPFNPTYTGLGKLLAVSSLQTGDIVSFSNSQTDKITTQEYGTPNGFIKRVIGLPGDTIEVRDGYIIRNNKPFAEPYTALPHSTFGGESLIECHQLTIPPHKIFVMGDNRKGSSDSRHQLGLVDVSDVDYILPLSVQKGSYDKFWRNTSEDFSPDTRIKLDKKTYLETINLARKSSGIPPLKYQPLLEKSALIRGTTMLKTNDFSFSATRSGVTQELALGQVGYWNPLWGESWQLGYYSSSELIENQLEFPETKKFLLDPQFQEMGISEIQGDINGCPTQVIVEHFAGYIPPNYSAEMVKSWNQALSTLKEIQPGWVKLDEYHPFYENHRQDIDRINTIINTRIQEMTSIVERLNHNQWLTKAQEKYLLKDETLSQEQNRLANKINSQ